MRSRLNKKIPNVFRKKLWEIEGERESELSELLPIKYVRKIDKMRPYKNNLLPTAPIIEAYKYGCVEMSEPIMAIIPYPTGLLGMENAIFVTDSGSYFAKYSMSGFTATKFSDEKMQFGVPYYYNGKHILVLSNGTSTGGIYKFDGKTLTKQTFEFRPSNICNHYGRIFALIGAYKIRFSDDLDPFNWNESITEGGYIEFGIDNGLILDMVSFNQYLYVFCVKGVMRITAYGDQTEFSVKPVNISVGEIYNRTMVNGGDRLIFFSSMGINIFDGFNHKVLFPELAEKLKRFIYYQATFKHNKYYLLAWKTTPNENYLIIYDVLENNYSIIANVPGEKICSLSFRQAGDVIIYQSTFYDNGVDQPHKAYYLAHDEILQEHRQVITNDLDFGYSTKYKLLKSITNGGQVPLTLNLNVDNRLYTYDIDGESVKVVNLKGTKFRFDFTSLNATGAVTPPVIEYQILGDI